MAAHKIMYKKLPEYRLFKGYLSLQILFFLFPIGLIAQTDCVDFNDYDSSQVWIKEIIKLDRQAQKDSFLKRIACERIIGKQNVKFSLDCIFDGLIAQEIPDYRDFLLKEIDSHNMQLISSPCENKNTYPEKCNLGFLIVSGLDRPIFDSISELTVRKIDRKKGRIKIIVKSNMSTNYDIRIENFCNKDIYQVDTKHLKKGKNRIEFSVDNELKFISIEQNGNKIILIK